MSKSRWLMVFGIWCTLTGAGLDFVVLHSSAHGVYCLGLAAWLAFMFGVITK